MKKYLLAAALVMASTAALAERITEYYVAYALGPNKNAAALYSVTYKNDPLNGYTNIGCDNQWNSYMSATYKDYFKWQTGYLGAFKTRSEAESAFREEKSKAMQKNKGFDNAISFSCTLD